MTALYGFNSKRNLYFVYLKYFDNLKECASGNEGYPKTG